MKGLYVCLVCRKFLSSLSSIINALFALSPLKFNSFRWCLWLCPILMGRRCHLRFRNCKAKKIHQYKNGTKLKMEEYFHCAWWHVLVITHEKMTVQINMFLNLTFPFVFYLFFKNVYLKCYLTLTSLNVYLLSLFSKYRYEQQKKKREQQKKSAGECLP